MTTRELEDYRQALQELPELCALLPDALTHRRAGTGVRSTPASRPPLRLDVVALMDTRDRSRWLDGMEFCDPESVGVLPYLYGWARDLEATALDTRPELPEYLPENPTVASISEWLLAEADWATTLPQWPELCQGTLQCWKAVRSAVSSLLDAQEPSVPCPRCGDEQGGRLTRVPGTAPHWRCTLCPHEVTVRAVTLRQASQTLGVPYTTLRDWARRPGLLSPVSDSPRQRLYDLGQISALVAERRLRSAG